MTIEEAQEYYTDGVECYTDYPVPFFDIDNELYMKKCYIIEPPVDKYAKVLVVKNKRYATYEVKIGYIYKQDEVVKDYIYIGDKL